MRKGRQKGQTKAKSIISDPLIAPYKITVEEDQYVLLDSKNIPQGYYSSLDGAINKVSRNVIANKKDRGINLVNILGTFSSEYPRYTDKACPSSTTKSKKFTA